VGEDSSPPGYADVWIGTEDAAASIFRAFKKSPDITPKLSGLYPSNRPISLHATPRLTAGTS
jgi:hypothetical protein